MSFSKVSVIKAVGTMAAEIRGAFAAMPKFTEWSSEATPKELQRLYWEKFTVWSRVSDGAVRYACEYLENGAVAGDQIYTVRSLVDGFTGNESTAVVADKYISWCVTFGREIDEERFVKLGSRKAIRSQAPARRLFFHLCECVREWDGGHDESVVLVTDITLGPTRDEI